MPFDYSHFNYPERTIMSDSVQLSSRQVEIMSDLQTVMAEALSLPGGMNIAFNLGVILNKVAGTYSDNHPPLEDEPLDLLGDYRKRLQEPTYLDKLACRIAEINRSTHLTELAKDRQKRYDIQLALRRRNPVSDLLRLFVSIDESNPQLMPGDTVSRAEAKKNVLLKLITDQVRRWADTGQYIDMSDAGFAKMVNEHFELFKLLAPRIDCKDVAAAFWQAICTHYDITRASTNGLSEFIKRHEQERKEHKREVLSEETKRAIPQIAQQAFERFNWVTNRPLHKQAADALAAWKNEALGGRVLAFPGQRDLIDESIVEKLVELRRTQLQTQHQEKQAAQETAQRPNVRLADNPAGLMIGVHALVTKLIEKIRNRPAPFYPMHDTRELSDLVSDFLDGTIVFGSKYFVGTGVPSDAPLSVPAALRVKIVQNFLNTFTHPFETDYSKRSKYNETVRQLISPFANDTATVDYIVRTMSYVALVVEHSRQFAIYGFTGNR